MRVLQVVTLVSPDGDFGGPVRVAANQTAVLRDRGHQVIVAAGSRGFQGRPPRELGGTPLRLFPVHRIVPFGFSGMFAPTMWQWLPAAMEQADVLHVHLARDLVTLPAAWLAQRRAMPYVLQPHGMVVGSSHPLAGPLDAGLTRRVLTGASAVLHLTPQESSGLQDVARGPLALRQLGNGVPAVDCVPALPARTEILFCARLQERKRPLMFVRMARELLARGVNARFVLVGPDEGEGPAVAAEVAAVGDLDRLRWEGPLEPSQTLARMARATMLVLPSVDEPYPMAVLEAMSVGRAVVVTQSCGLAPAVRQYGCGLVVDESLEGLVDAVWAALTHPGTLLEMAGRAAVAARQHFSMTAVVDQLEDSYREAVAGNVRTSSVR